MKNHQLFFWMIVVLFNIKLPIEVKCQPVLEWENKFDLENRSDESFKMLLDNEGNIYNAGTSFNIFTKNEIVYFKLNSNGFQEWFQDVSNFYFDDITDYAIDGSNDLYVTGYYTDSFFYTNGFIQKTNSSGTYLWGDTTGFVVFESIAIDDSNNVYALYSDFAVGITKYDSSGQIKFNVRNDSTLNGNFVLPWIITLDPANNIYVSGTSTLESDDEYMLKKFSSGGNFLWGVTYNPTEEDDRPRFVSIDEYSNIYIYGVIGGGDPGQGVALVKFDSSGNFLWDQQILAPISVAIGLSINKNGELVIGGISFINNKLTHSITQYSKDGDLIWSYYADDSLTWGNLTGSMTVDEENEIYYTGCIRGPGNLADILLFKLDAYGNLLWKIKYNSASNNRDIAIDIGLDFNNDILISGYSFDSISNNDILTLKYSQPTQISEIDLGKSVNISPNPFYSEATIQLQNLNYKAPIQLRWYDLPGRLIRTENIHSKNNYTITREGINNGMYIITLMSENKTIGTAKIVVQ